MAAPTAIPHPETSSHHQPQQPVHEARLPSDAPQGPAGAAGTRYARNSPPLLSPVYTRTAFSLPGGPIGSPGGAGPNATGVGNNFRGTATGGWTTAGVQPQPNTLAAVKANGVTPQKDQFFERSDARHQRTSSISSSTSSIDSMGPATPRSETAPTLGFGVGGAPLGRVQSIPLASSYEASKARRDSWAAPSNFTYNVPWASAGLGSLRGGAHGHARQTPSASVSEGVTDNSANLNGNAAAAEAKDASLNSPSSAGSAGSGGIGNLFRRLSLSGGGAGARGSTGPSSANGPPPTQHNHNHNHRHGHRSASISTYMPTSAPAAGGDGSFGLGGGQDKPNVLRASPPATAEGVRDAGGGGGGGTPPQQAQQQQQARGRARQGSLGAGSGSNGAAAKRRPSPHGERLLMGWTHAH